eukprot:TRINITY_DN29092_c0_g1_i2.p1 TRINITY_DN29092_c0_g1~~TRINITY_DN29092_c0_g1_i2.p1  ORF type:complete len:919 (-),score=113.21 TRINITY_DN29092_c0_g1_i2:86-2842(-)
MIVPLSDGVAPVRSVGGKAASLMKLYSTPEVSKHVPRGFALSVDFFDPWVEQVVTSDAWRVAEPSLRSKEAPQVCSKLKDVARSLTLTNEQAQVLRKLGESVATWPHQLAAVRSSCPEEDGATTSFAGVFETKLGVTPASLEQNVRECFASVFDHRVFSYAGVHKPAFAAVVMEMVDSYTAGVAFSANPLNSDLDEMLVDSSWGLGESVVDGSVVADRIIWDKVNSKLIEKSIGSKKQERRLRKDGGVDVRPVEDDRQRLSTLSDEQVKQLANLVSSVEKAYGMPMDTEWAHTEDGDLKILQARPITTIHPLDTRMITAPGQKRVLYYDFNVASEATTTSPFTPMDIDPYNKLLGCSMGIPGFEVRTDPDQLMFVGATRYYVNLSHVMKVCSMGTFAHDVELLDPYLANIFRSDECSRSKYQAKRFLPSDTSCCDAFRFVYRLKALLRMWSDGKKFAADPVGARATRDKLYQDNLETLKALEKRGLTDDGLQHYFDELFDACMPVLIEDVGAIMAAIMPLFNSLNKTRLNGKTTEEKDEADALLGGYEGDPIMEANIAMYELANKLPSKVWSEYKGRFSELASRIASNLSGKAFDLPTDFLQAWKDFMYNYGWDGKDQLFVSSERYMDNPVMLLGKLQHSAGDSIMDPSVAAREKYKRRQQAMARRQSAVSGCFAMLTGRKKRIEKENAVLENLMCLRNAPKLLLSRAYAAFRKAVLQVEDQLLAAKRLDNKGDIFMLLPTEIDTAIRDASIDLRSIVQPRMQLFKRAQQAKSCPMLIDSRCRILKPNVVKGEPGTLIGAPISPGVGTGYVRIVTHPEEPIEEGEVLATVVTDPAWTPLFVGASAIILQVGGALQHGALCAREYGKPAVSGIDVMAELKTGMLVSVDGNTGVVKIMEGEPVKKMFSKHLSSQDLETKG